LSARPLAWLGRQGPRAIAVLVGIAIAAPPIAALQACVRRPALAIAATA